MSTSRPPRTGGTRPLNFCPNRSFPLAPYPQEKIPISSTSSNHAHLKPHQANLMYSTNSSNSGDKKGSKNFSENFSNCNQNAMGLQQSIFFSKVVSSNALAKFLFLLNFIMLILMTSLFLINYFRGKSYLILTIAFFLNGVSCYLLLRSVEKTQRDIENHLNSNLIDLIIFKSYFKFRDHIFTMFQLFKFIWIPYVIGIIGLIGLNLLAIKGLWDEFFNKVA